MVYESSYSASERFLAAQNNLVTQASDFSLETIASMVDEGIIDPLLENLRRDRWTEAQQSALIESFLLNMPVPPVYLAEGADGRYSIIDGRQRITAIHSFMRGRLALRSLQVFHELEGARIGDLPDLIANSLKVRPHIRAVTLLRQSLPNLKYEVFERLNLGGQALTSQEVRNVAFEGPLNDLLMDLSETPFFRRQLQISKNSARFRRMQDLEIVLRFIALAENGPENFRPPLPQFLDRFMFDCAYEPREKLSRHEYRFKTALEGCEQIWGERAFRGLTMGRLEGPASLAIYDAQMLAVLRAGKQDVARAASQSEKVIRQTAHLLEEDAALRKSISQPLSSSKAIALRVERFTALILNA